MNTKTLCVFYGQDLLPYKDSERTTHYPLCGNAFMGASLTSEIRFYVDQIGGNDMEWVACSKLPNGKIGSKVLTTYYDTELEEYYALLPLSSFYTQYKGDLYISLQGYNGGIDTITDPVTGIVTIVGTPVIQATGSIKLNIAYATQFVGSGEEENITLQRILGELGKKIDKSDNKVIKSVNGIANINDGTYDSYFEGSTPFIDRQSGKMYLGIKVGNDIYYEPLYLDLRNVVEISDLSSVNVSQLTDLVENKFACILYNGVLYYKTNGSLPLVFKAITSTIAQEQDEYRIYEQFITIDTSDWVTITATASSNGVSVYDTEQVDSKIASAISSVYRYKGSVATYDDLPSSDLTIGDVYNVEDTGDNYAWTGTAWDKLAGVVDLSNYVTISDLTSALALKQDKLVSGTNIKTINNISLLGSGNINIQGGGGSSQWGQITGDIQDQTDLQNEFQDIREVAEGKASTFILSYDDDIAFIKTKLQIAGKFYVYNSTTNDFEDKTTELLNGDYDNIYIANYNFNSQNDSINLIYDTHLSGLIFRGGSKFDNYSITIDEGRDFFYISSPDVLMKLGDNILVVETDVPDRWFASKYAPYLFYKLETAKIDLTTYATKSEMNTEDNKVAHDIALEYDENTLYGVGDLCIKDKVLYKCNTANTTGTWDSTKWNSATVNGELALKANDADVVHKTGAETITGVKTLIAPIIKSTESSNYGLVSPNTSSWTADKTIATTDDFGYPVMDAPTSANPQVLTGEQIAKVRKGVKIKGEFLGYKNPVLESPEYIGTEDTTLYGIIRGRKNNQYTTSVGVYSLNTQTKIIHISNGGQANYLSFDFGAVNFTGQVNLGSANSNVNVKGKAVPNYPSSPTKPQALIYDTDNSLKYIDTQKQWFGTQQEYDALQTYDSNTIYNILES